MKIGRTTRKIAKSPAELARIQALREKYQGRPTPQELLASGEYSAPLPLGVYLKIKQLMHQLKEARANARLSLADLADRTEIDRGYLSKLENMQQANTTLETLSRIADALGLEIRLLPVNDRRNLARNTGPVRKTKGRRIAPSKPGNGRSAKEKRRPTVSRPAARVSATK